MALSEDKIRGYKNFANKIWNAGRFILDNTKDYNVNNKPEISINDKKLIKELEQNIKDISEDIENYRFYLAGEKLYHYFWHTFADKIIEESKARLIGDNENDKKSAQWMLLEIFSTLIKILHPFMPFITEEIWSFLPIKNKELLMIETWPVINGDDSIK